MNVHGMQTPDNERALVEMLAARHEEGLFVRDPSPSAVVWNDGAPRIPESELENRSSTHVPRLAVSQLWSLMFGWSPRRKLSAARLYLMIRGMTIDDLEEALREHTEAEIERCFHKNRDFKVVQYGDLVWHVRRALLTEAHRPALEDPDSLLEPGPRLIKAGQATTIAQVPGGGVLKRFNLKRYRNLVKYRFAPSRARRAFQLAYRLEMLGIRTPRVIAYTDRHVLGSTVRSYLLMEYVAQARPAAEVFREWAEGGEEREQRARALLEAGRLVGLLHGAGFANRDLKASNLLLTEAGELCLVDLDGLQHLDEVNEETRIKNLRRIVRDLPLYGPMTVRDRLVFLRAYARSVRRGDARTLFRRLAEEPWE